MNVISYFKFLFRNRILCLDSCEEIITNKQDIQLTSYMYSVVSTSQTNLRLAIMRKLNLEPIIYKTFK